MVDLVARGVITLVDRFTGPLNRVAGQAQSINSRLQKSIEPLRRHSAAVGAAVGGGLFMGFQSAKDFEKSIFGVGVASIGDSIAAGKDATGEALRVMQSARKAAMELSSEVGLAINKTGEIAESTAKAGVAVDNVKGYSRTIAQALLTDSEASVEALADYGASIEKLYEKHRKLTGLELPDYFRKVTGAAVIAASETSLSTGSFLEGQRQYGPLGAAIGLTPEQNAALLAGAKKASGMNHIELGQTEKSIINRLMVPTADNLKARSQLGFNPAERNADGSFRFMDLVAQDADKATAALVKATNNRIRGESRSALLSMIAKAQQDGTFGTGEFNDRLMGNLGKVMGLDMSQEANVEKVQEMIANSLYAPGSKINLPEILNWYANSEQAQQNPGLVARSFEAKRSALVQGILAAHRRAGPNEKSTYDEMLDQISKGGDTVLDKVQEAFDESPYGKMMRMGSAISRLNAAFFQNDGVIAIINGISSGLERLSTLDPKKLELLGNVLLGSFLLGPILNVIGAIGGLVGMMFRLGGAIKYLTAGPAAVSAITKLLNPFSMASQGAIGGRAAAAANARMLAGMGASSQASQRMIQGMSALGGGAQAPKATGFMARLSAMMGRIGSFLSPITGFFSRLGGMLLRIAGWGLRLLTGPIGLAITAGTLIYTYWDQISAGLKSVWNWMKDLWSSIKNSWLGRQIGLADDPKALALIDKVGAPANDNGLAPNVTGGNVVPLQPISTGRGLNEMTFHHQIEITGSVDGIKDLRAVVKTSSGRLNPRGAPVPATTNAGEFGGR